MAGGILGPYFEPDKQSHKGTAAVLLDIAAPDKKTRDRLIWELERVWLAHFSIPRNFNERH
jgi:hypothetical protein